MPESTSTPAAVAGPDDLRLVLFGLPGSGKSALLAALGEAARSQTPLLGGRLVSPAQGLPNLDQRLSGEVVAYPIKYEPTGANGKALGNRLDAVLVDSDGRAANNLLKGKQTLDEDSPEGTLAHEVVDADALILAVDASKPSRQMETDFAAFNQFLKTMQQDRGERAEVAGLPIYLVLTKCDLLAKPSDTSIDWMEHIEQRKREVDAHFREFHAGDALEAANSAKKNEESDLAPVQGAGGFGRLDLRIWATAVERPALRGSPARPHDPFGVAELFRQCLGEAQDYRDRCRRSSWRLLGAVLGSASLVTGMLALALSLLLAHHNSGAAMLEARVEDFRFLNRGDPAERLKGTLKQLRLKETALQEMHDDPEFRALNPDLREFVQERLDELREYIPYREKVDKEERALAAERTEEGLERRVERLRKELALPRPDWEGTHAALRRQQGLVEAEALQAAVQAVRNWYLESADSAGKLWAFGEYEKPADINWGDWTTKTLELTDPKRKLKYNASDPIPGAPLESLLSYGTAMRFDRVFDARATWAAERARLVRLLQICSALGLATPSSARPALLVFPTNFTLANARVRVAELKKFYPDYATAFVLNELPDAIVPLVRQVVRTQYQILLTPARAEVLRQLRLAATGTEETKERWDTVRVWLRDPDDLASWRELVGVLLRLEDPAAEDPVKVLAAFLGKEQFTIDADRIDKLTVEIPKLRGLEAKDKRTDSPRDKSLVIKCAGKNGESELVFTLSGAPASTRRATVYTYRLSRGQRLVYRPGDKDRLWAELPLQDGKKLVWVDSRSKRYQMEALRNPPRVVSASAKEDRYSAGRKLDDVRLIITPDDAVPRVPDLMPEVRLTD